MEVDNEVSGNGNSYTTEFRQYDPRLGRWKSLDPLMGMFPSVSPYVGFDNNPIYYVDPYGLSPSTDGEPDKVITVENTEADDDAANRTATLENMEKVASGTIVKFVYPDDSREKEFTFTYDSEGNDWNGEYSYNTSLDATASWNHRGTGHAKVFGSEENLGGELPAMIAKVEPETPVVNPIESEADQAGQIQPVRQVVRRPRRNPTPNPPPPPVPPQQPVVRNVNIQSNFTPNTSRLVSATNTRNSLNATIWTLRRNPNATIRITANLQIPGANNWNGVMGNLGFTRTALGWNRYNRIRRMLIAAGVQPNQISGQLGVTNAGMNFTGVLTIPPPPNP